MPDLRNHTGRMRRSRTGLPPRATRNFWLAFAAASILSIGACAFWCWEMNRQYESTHTTTPVMEQPTTVPTASSQPGE